VPAMMGPTHPRTHLPPLTDAIFRLSSSMFPLSAASCSKKVFSCSSPLLFNLAGSAALG